MHKDTADYWASQPCTCGGCLSSSAPIIFLQNTKKYVTICGTLTGVWQGSILWIWGQTMHFMVCVPLTDLHRECGSAVCLASIRGSVFLNTSVKAELTCSGIFPPAYNYKQHLSWSSPSTRCACLHTCVYMHRGESFKFKVFFHFFPFLQSVCLLHVFLYFLSRTMVWPQPFPLPCALPSNTAHSFHRTCI